MDNELQDLRDELEDTQMERDNAQDYLATLEDDLESAKERIDELVKALYDIQQIVSGII